MDARKFRYLCDEVLLQPVINELNTKDVYAQIQELCKSFNWNIRRDCYFLKKELIYSSICFDEELRPYLDIASMIFDASNSILEIEVDSSSNSKPWRKLVEICISAKENCHYFDSSYDHYSHYNKVVDFSHASKKLMGMGIKFKVIDNKFYFDDASHGIIDEIIRGYALRIGGINIVCFSFEVLSKYYNSKQERFQIYRKTTQGNEIIHPEFPWGYIIALGVKYSNAISSCGPSTIHDEFIKFIDFMRDLISSFEIQPYSVWESVYVSPEDTIQFLQDNVLYDNLISFFQIKKNHALEILDFISSKHDMSIKSYGLKLRTIFDVAKGIMNLSNPLLINTISAENIRLISRSSKKNINSALERIFETSNEQGLAFPPSSEEIEHVLRPVTKFKGHKVILPSAITNLAAINSAIVQISKPNGVFDNAADSKVGKYLESFLLNRFERSGIKVFSGDFSSIDGKIKGDCDLIISSPEFFYIFELKKKALTRKAMNGEDYVLIKDLGDSVMRSQSQCAKIEYVLVHDNHLNLKRGKITDVVIYNEKPIQKISVSLHDFGALQDRIVFSTILKLAMQTNFSSKDPAIDSYLIKWREYLDVFINYRGLTAAINEMDIYSYMDNSFMSLPQLMTMLDDCGSIQDFDERFKTARVITYSTRDFYKEYSHMAELKNR